MGDELRITGLVETQQMVRAVPSDIAKGLEPATIAAGAVIQQELLNNTPRRKEEREIGKSRFPPLAASLITDIAVSQDHRFAVASTGYGNAGPVALWLEYGHRIVSHRGVDSGKKTMPNPFMRRSAESCADRAIDAFAEVIGVRVMRT
jgi:hypothetical protein